MSGAALVNGFSALGDSFLRAYQTQSDRIGMQAARNEETAWKNEERAYTRAQRERESAFRLAMEKAGSAAQVDAGTLVTDSAGSNAFTKDADAAAMMADMSAARGQTPKVSSATRVQGESYTDPTRARAAEAGYNSTGSRLARMGLAAMPFNPEKGISLQRSAADERKAQAEQAKTEKAEVDERFNTEITNIVTSRRDWWVGAAEMATRSKIPGLEGVQVVPELSADGKTVEFKATMPDGSVKVVGNYEANEKGAQKWVQGSARVDTKTKIGWLNENMKVLLEAEGKVRDAQEKRSFDDYQTANRIKLDRAKTASRGARTSGARTSGDVAKGPTVAQARTNAEIDAARRVVSETDPAELQRRTTSTNRWGARNSDFDPALARAVTLANRRKYGQDQDFDGGGASGSSQATTLQIQRSEKAPAVDRFKGDKAMQSNRLGKQTEQGYEVLDSKGKLIGYYR